jgi:hypothetical protein
MRRRSGRAENVVSAVGVRDRGGVNEAVVEAALNRDGFRRRNKLVAFSLGPGINERAAAFVLQDELVPEKLGDSSFQGDGAPFV